MTTTTQSGIYVDRDINGRPQDRGYSRGGEKEYAVHDTKMAFDEAKAKDITAFALTVDKNGHDYLATMCQYTRATRSSTTSCSFQGGGCSCIGD